MRFFVVFVPDSTTFAADPRVVESVTGSVSVEHPHNSMGFLWSVMHDGLIYMLHSKEKQAFTFLKIASIYPLLGDMFLVLSQ